MSHSLVGSRRKPRLTIGMAMVLVAVSGVGLANVEPRPALGENHPGHERGGRPVGALAMKALSGKYPSISPDRAITELIAALNDPHRNVRADAAAALGQGDQAAERAIPALIVALSDPDLFTRMNAAGSLCEIIRRGAPGRNTVVTALIGALGDSSPTVRAVAASSLGLILQPDGPGCERATAALLRMLNDPERDVRVHAAWSLIHLALGDACIGPLIEILGDTQELVQLSAMDSLGEIGPPAKAALPELHAILENHPRLYMKEAAAKAISRISQPDAR